MIVLPLDAISRLKPPLELGLPLPAPVANSPANEATAAIPPALVLRESWNPSSD